MEDREINRKLALAIGYAKNDVWQRDWRCVSLLRAGRWEKFDYMAWHTIGPIAARYDCFPFNGGSGWCAYAESVSRSVYSDTPQKAIALAVIAAHEAGVLKGGAG